MSMTDIQTIARNARLVADALDKFPAGIERPTHEYISALYSTPRLAWLIFHEDDQKDRAAAIIRAIGGHWDKTPSKLFGFTTHFHGVELSVVVDRVAVCERVVTGTREVTKQVSDPAAPLIYIIETVEDVEWRCEPLLAEVTS